MAAFTDELKGWKAELDRCSLMYKSLDEKCPFLGAVYGAVDEYTEASPVTPLPVPDAQSSEEELRAGRSLGIRPRIETSKFVELLLLTAAGMTASNPDLAGAVDDLRQGCDRLLAGSGSDISVEEALEFRRALADAGVLAKDMAAFLFTVTLSSFYRQLLGGVSGSVRLDLYDGGKCPTCGQKPHYGTLRKEDNAKLLNCWLCGTQWSHTRISCPFCDNRDVDQLGYFTVEGNDACRVSFCRACSGYYKIIDTRNLDMSGGINLSIHNLATLSYDSLARQEGFSPGSELEWVNDPD